MSIFDKLTSVIVPHDCLGCGREGKLLCQACAGSLAGAPDCCYRCWQPSDSGLTCPGCLEAGGLRQVRAATLYEGPAKQLVRRLKFTGAQAASREIAVRMVPLARAMKSGRVVIVPVPTVTSHVRQRGYDQAKLLARGLAGQARLPYADCLYRTGQTRQVGASRQQRREQLQGVFGVRRPAAVRGRRIILVDDVLTTGATLEAAAAALLAAGAAEVNALVFAQAPPSH